MDFIMEYRENPMFGRKVFFLNPPLSIENYVVENLKSQEYEVYIIREYNLAKPVLRNYGNSICFIYIDDELSFDGWFNFIKSFEIDESLNKVFLGVLSFKTKPKDQERFLMNLKLPGGFVRLDRKTEIISQQIEGILKINGAKGVRQVIRLDLRESKDVNGYFNYGTILYSFRLIDISVMGFATIVPAKMGKIFKKDSFFKNISITMGRYSFYCNVLIFESRIVGDNCTVVALFTDGTSPEIKKKIHDFVYDTLEKRNRIFMESLARDFTDYSIRFVEPKEENPKDKNDKNDGEVVEVLKSADKNPSREKSSEKSNENEKSSNESKKNP